MIENLKKLISIYSVSGFEQSLLKDLFSEYFDIVKTDNLNNTIGIIKSKKAVKKVLIEAHFDTVGLIVTKIDNEGFISFTSIGGIDPRILVGSEVLILGSRAVKGVIGFNPPHISNKDVKSPKITDLRIDTGYPANELNKLVSVGSPISYVPKIMQINDFIAGTYLDNKVSLALILSMIENIKGFELDFDLYVLASSREETGREGALTATTHIKPDLCIILDVTHGSTHDCSNERTVPLGSGAAICRGTSLSKRYTQKLVNAFNDCGIPYQFESEPDDTGTDSYVMYTTNCGVPCILISTPLRYMHTPLEMASVSDINSVSDGIAAFIKKLSIKDF